MLTGISCSLVTPGTATYRQVPDPRKETVLPIALFFGRRQRQRPERPAPSVLDEEYEWVYGQKPHEPGEKRVGDKPGVKAEDPAASEKQKFDWHSLSPRHH